MSYGRDDGIGLLHSETIISEAGLATHLHVHRIPGEIG